MMSSTGQVRWFVREGEKAMEEAEGEQKESIVPGQGQHMQRLRINKEYEKHKEAGNMKVRTDGREG